MAKSNLPFKRVGQRKPGPSSSPPSNLAKKVRGIVSMFMIDIEEDKNAYKYDVDISVVDEGPNGKRRQRSYAKGADDGQVALFRDLCSRLMSIANTKSNNFGMSTNGAYIYDKRAIFFTSEPIDIKNDISISREETDEFVRKYTSENARFVVKIVPCENGHILEIGKKMPEQMEKSMPLRVFLEMATSQHAFDSKTFANIGAGKFYMTDEREVVEAGRGIQLRHGVKKGVRIVENKGKPCPALILDVTTSAFFKRQNLLTTIQAIRGKNMPRTDKEWTEIIELLEDVRVEPTYARLRSFGIGRFTKKAASETLLKDGNGLTIADYFSQVKKISLSHAGLRGVIPNTQLKKDQPATYPIELLEIMPNQRVSITKMDRDLSEKLLKANAVKPNVRLSKIMERADQLGVFNSNNKVLKAFGLKILKDSNEIALDVRPPPQIQFRDKVIKNPNPESTRFDSRNAKYVTTQQISHWIILFPEEQQRLIEKFIVLFEESTMKKRHANLVQTRRI